jgi:hypothetical protein
LNGWVGQLEAGMSPEAVEASLVASPEYFQAHGNTLTTWLGGLYQDLLGRTPDAAGFNAVLGQAGTRTITFQIALGFTTSAERESLVIGQDYAAFLGRAPDAAGQSAWLNALAQGANRLDVEAGIIASDEYFQRQGSDNIGFVSGVYRDVLHRPAAAAEVNGWLPFLAPPAPTGMVDSNGNTLGP